MSDQENQAMNGREGNYLSNQTLYNFIVKLNDATSLRAIIQCVAEPAFQAGATETQLFLFYQDENERLAYANMAVNWQPSGRTAQIPEGTRLNLADFPLINQWLMNPDDPILISDLAIDDRLDVQAKALLQHNGIISTIVLPLVLDKRWIGLIFINWETQHHFKPDDAGLYRVFARQATIAVNNRMLIDQTNRRALELATVAEISTTIASQFDTQEMLQTVVDLTKERFGLYHAHIYLLNADGEDLVLSAGAGKVGKQMAAQGWLIPLEREQSLVARAARSRKGVIINNVQAEPDFLPNDLLPDTRSEMAIPLLAGETLLGVLDVQADIVGRFTFEDVGIHTTLAFQVAVALQNSRQFSQVQKQEHLVGILYQASAAINAAHSYDGILDALRTYTVAGRGAHGVSINLFDQPWTSDQAPEWINTIAYYSNGLLPPEVIPPRHLVKDFPAISATLHPDQISIFEDIENSQVMDKNARALYSKIFKSKSAIFAPLLAAGQWIGFINVLYAELASFSEEDVDLLTGLIGQIAVAVQNLRTTEQIEAALKDLSQNDARLSEALERAKMAYWEYDVPTGIYTFNDQFYSIYHTTAKEQGGYKMSAQDYSKRFTMPAEDGPIVFSAIQKALETTDPNYSKTLEHRFIRSDGTEGYLTVRFRIAKDKEGHTIKFIGANQDSTEQKLAELALARNASQLATVAEISTMVSKQLNSQEMLQTVVDMTKERFGLYHAHIYLLNADGNTLTLAAGAGKVGKKMVTQGWQIPWDRKQSLVARALRNRQSVIINDVRAEPGFMPNELLPHTRAEMAVPMLVGDTLLGVLDVQANVVGRFTNEDARIMDTLSAQVAVAVQNSRQFGQVQQQEQLVSTLYQASAAINTAKSYDDILDALRSYTIAGCGAHGVDISMFDRPWTGDQIPEWINTIAYYSSGLLSPEVISPRYRVKDFPAISTVFHSDRITIIADVEHSSEMDDNGRFLFSKVLKAKTALIAPLLVAGQWIGYINLLYPEITVISDQDIRLLAGLTGQIGVAVQNLHNIQQVESTLEDLSQNEARLSEALDIAKLANWEYDVEKDIFTFNDNFYSIFHTTAEREGGYQMSSAQYATRLVHPEDVPLVGSAIEKALASTDQHYSTKLEHRVIYADGGTGYISVIVHIDRDENGHIVRYYGANQDVTERIAAEKALRESDAFQRTLLDNLGLGIIIVDPKTHIVESANPATVAMFGADESQIIGLKCHQVLCPAHEGACPITDLGQVVDNSDRQLVRVDGSRIPVLKSVRRIAIGGQEKLLESFIDISDRKKAEEALKTSQEKLTEALVTAKMGYWEYDVLSGIYSFNDQFYSIYHTTVKEQGGYTMSAQDYSQRFTMPEEDGPVVFGEIQKALETTDPNYSKTIVHRFIRSDGTIGYLTVRFHIVKDDQGRTVKFIGANQDTTDQKLAELALERNARQLTTVAEVSTTVTSKLDPKEMLQTVVDLAKERFGLYHAHIYLVDGDQLNLAAGAGEVGRQMVEQGWQIPLDREQSLVARAARTHHGIIINNVRAEPGFMPNPLLPDTLAEMAVPMLVGDMLVGVLDVQADSVGRFTEEDINIQTTLSAQVAVALQNSRQFAQIQQQEQLVRAIIDSTPDLIYFKDTEHRYRLANQIAANSVLHKMPAEVIGKNDLELGFPEELVLGNPEKGISGYWADDDMVMKGGEAKVYPNNPIIMDGVIHTFHTFKTPLTGIDGKISGVLAFSRDISDQLKAEESLRQNEARLVEALITAKMGYWEYDVLNGIYTFNDEFYSIYHTTVEEQGGYIMSAQDYSQRFTMPEEDGPVVFGEIQKALETSDPNYSKTLVHRYIRSDGTIGYLTVRFHIVKDSEGRTIKFIGANQDTTEQKLAELTLAKRAAQLATVTNVATAVATILAPEILLQKVVDLTKQSFGLYHAHIYLLNEAGTALVLAAGAGEVGKLMTAQGWQIPLDREQSLVARSARTRQGIIVSDVRSEPDFMPNPLLPETRSEMAVPMVVGENLLGVLDVQSNRPAFFTVEDVQIETTLAIQVAVALQNARTFAQSQRQAEQEALINEISQKIQTTTSVESAMQVAVRELGRALGAKRTSVQLSLDRKKTVTGSLNLEKSQNDN